MPAYCPKCEDVLPPGARTCTACGWVSAETGAAAPTLNDFKAKLVDTLARWPVDRWPYGMPTDAGQAVDWFLHLVRPHQREEAPRSVRRRDGKGSVWVWPYEQRVAFELSRFLHAPTILQRRVVAANDDGITWRGDDLEMFDRIIAEHERQREIGLDAYRAEALALRNPLKRVPLR